MASKFYSQGLKKTALSVALGLCFASPIVLAQSSVGSVFGSAKPNATVSIDSASSGSHREITADAAGRFSLNQLAPGTYKITSDGVSRDVVVRAGTGSEVNLASSGTTSLDTVTVVGGTSVNPIDVSSVESTTIFTAEQLRKLPIDRDVSSVALLAPGTVKGDAGLGNGKLASFGGASVAENGYYINGFDVTDLRKLVSFADLPFEAIGEQQVKTGGYGAEYGRSLGGVISLVTKRGSNEWHGGVSAYWSPDSLREKNRDVIGYTFDADGNVVADGPSGGFRSANSVDELEWNVYGSGPIVKDRLFFFALINGRHDTSDVFGRNNSFENSDSKPMGVVKLDWNITDNHILEGTYIRNEKDTKTITYSSATDWSTTHDGSGDESHFLSGGDVWIVKYTGYLTDNFTVSAQYGEVDNLTGKLVSANQAATLCPAVYTTPGLTYLGCWDPNQFTVTDPFADDNSDKRKAWRIDFEWNLGDHRIRAGYDTEQVDSYNAGLSYSGGVYWRYFSAPGTGSLNGQSWNQPYVRKRFYQTTSGSFSTENTAYYLEDSWHISDNWTLYGGIRVETFENLNADGDAFVSSGNLWAPRLGFSWDVNGDSTLKVFGNAGRYFIPVANNTNIRASSAEEFYTEYYAYSGVDPVTGAPTTGTQIGPRVITTAGVTPDPRTVADNDLSPMYQDEYILGLQKDFGNGWTGGARAIFREVKSGMDDYCSPYAIYNFAQDTGHPNHDVFSQAPCMIVNPGEDVTLFVDLDGTGDYTEVEIPASYFNLPKYKRSYSAVEFFFEKSSDKWFLQGSYTFSRSKGNVEGYVNSTLDQDDPGLTQEFDYASFQDGTYGFLPNDRTHVIKAFGSYNLTDTWRIGANISAQSGRPRNCNGFVPSTVPDFDAIDGLGGAGSYSSASSFYCLKEDGSGESELIQRGRLGRTDWTYRLDASVAWTPKIGMGELTLQMNVFNVFNSHTVQEFNETHDYARATTQINPNYGLPTSFQTPRSVQFVARWEF